MSSILTTIRRRGLLAAALLGTLTATVATAPAVAADPAGSIAEMVYNAGTILTDDKPAPMPAAGEQTIYPAPLADPFYHAAPGELDALANGQLVRQRPVQLPVFAGFDTRQLAFKSIDSSGKPILATSLVIRPPHVRVDNPILSYQHFVNGLSPKCQPSEVLQHPTAEAFQDNAMGALRISLSKGTIVTIPDHLGPNSAYVAGRLSGHIILDNLRAVTTEPGQALFRSPVGMLGYSGGGLATGWAAAIAPGYAPELDLVGAAQGGVPTDIMAMAHGLGDQRHPIFGLAFASAIALSREYPDQVKLIDKLSPLGLDVMRKISNACQLGIVKQGYQLGLQDVAPGVHIDSEPGLVSAYRANSLDFFPGTPKAPIYMWHAGKDQLVPYDASARTARRYCQAGTPMTFGTADTGEHMIGFAVKYPEVVRWLDDRFHRVPVTSNCGQF